LLRADGSKDLYESNCASVQSIERGREYFDRLVPGISNLAACFEHWLEIAGDNNSVPIDSEHSPNLSRLGGIHHYQEISDADFGLCNGSGAMT
jgi:hypothetical protein